jgi:hypothetical protein
MAGLAVQRFVTPKLSLYVGGAFTENTAMQKGCQARVVSLGWVRRPPFASVPLFFLVTLELRRHDEAPDSEHDDCIPGRYALSGRTENARV